MLIELVGWRGCVKLSSIGKFEMETKRRGGNEKLSYPILLTYLKKGFLCVHAMVIISPLVAAMFGAPVDTETLVASIVCPIVGIVLCTVYGSMKKGGTSSTK